MKKPINWILSLALVSFVTVCITVPIIFNRLSNQAQHNNDGITAIICHIENIELKNPKLTHHQKKQAIKFWNQTLAIIHQSPCAS